MEENGRVPPLTRRVPGAAVGPSPVSPAGRPALPESLLQRMQAAVDAAHAQEAAQIHEHPGRQEQAEPPGTRASLPQRVPGAADSPKPPARVARAGLAASIAAFGPEAEDETPPIQAISAPVISEPASPAVSEPLVQPERAGEPAGPPKAARPPKPARPAKPASRPGQPPSGQNPAAGRSRRKAGVVILAAVVIAGSLGILLFGHNATTSGADGAAARALSNEVATRNRAAAWVASQVTQGAIVSCGPLMCEALEAQRIPASDLDELRPGTGDPLSSVVIVATAAVRSEFGGRLSSVYAPAVIASFGSGSGQIAIRVIASHGAAAYESALSADLAARKA